MRSRAPTCFLVWISGLACVVLPSVALAHDFWIEPSTFRPIEGAPFEVALRMGERTHGKPYPRVPDRIVRFELVGPPARETRAEAVQGSAGWEPAGIARAERPGLHSVVYLSTPNTIELAAAEFDAYLAEKGLDAALAARAALPEPRPRGRERYVRCAKALIAVEPRARHRDPQRRSQTPAVGATGAASGLPLELVADASPYAAALPGSLPIRLLYRGRPLAGALVVASPTNELAAAQSLRSDADGRVEIRLDRAGGWLVTASHMVALHGDATADWQSYWASLTFEVPASSDLQH